MSFAHLHLHTEYSLLDGACRIGRLFDAVKKNGQSAVAITDHGVMYGVVDFYKAAKKSGIKPIIGCEVYVAPRSRFNKEKHIDGDYSHLVLLCENNKGYENLMQLVSRGFTEGFYTKPRVDIELLREYHEGIIALSACLAGDVPKNLLRNNYEEAKKKAILYNEIFGEGNFFLELQDHGLTEQQRVNPLIKRIANETGIPLVATNDVHYVEKQDALMQKVLICIGTNHTLNEDNPLEFKTNEFYLKSEEEMRELFDDTTEAIENTGKIADRCDVELEFGKIKLPFFDIGEKDHYEHLRTLCFEGLRKNYGDNPEKEVIERLEYELETINKMGYVDYYLIVADFVNFAKKKGIPVGPGRGSGAGSIAAYCVGITGIDPIKYNLLFERFLNPERVSMPDFDIDFCYVRRQEVIDYVISKYGADHVAQIVTFGTLAARAAVRDVGRAMALPYNVCDTAAKLIPMKIGMTIERALEESAELKEKYINDTAIHDLIDMAKRIEGMPRHASTHAAGVVITDKPVSLYVPLARNDEAVVTQYTMTALDELGLLKMDFLGLRNLTVIADTEKEIRRYNPLFSAENIPIDDKETYKMIAAGQTEGVFQFESAGMKSVSHSLKPEGLEDMIAIISLYRPGPMDSIPKYIHNRHNKGDIKYPSEKLRDILDVTYGCMVYQEQVMQVFRSLAGYSLGRADIVRRAMSKKKHDVMQKEREVFINGLKDEKGNIICEGAVKRGMSESAAEKLFDEMSAFSSYAFNKSHAAAYALVAYRTAYLKCHYPKEYLASLLTSVLDSSDKVSKYIAESQRLGVRVLPPSVNDSRASFSVETDGIRFGLLGIKNLGLSLIEQLCSERERNGKYESIYDFCMRLTGRELNKRAVEALIKAGALDNLGSNRREMLQSLESVMSEVDSQKRKRSGGQLGLFDSSQTVSSFKMPIMEEMPHNELIKFEKETTGIYISGHPMQEYEKHISALKATKISSILEKVEIGSLKDGDRVKVVALATSIKKKTTRSEQQMMLFKAEDMTAGIGVLVFPAILSKCGNITEGEIVIISGRISLREEREPEIICDDVVKFTAPKLSTVTVEKGIKPGLYLRIPSLESQEYKDVRKLIEENKGDIDVFVVCEDTKKRFVAPKNMRISKNEGFFEELRHILSEKNVKFVE